MFGITHSFHFPTQVHPSSPPAVWRTCSSCTRRCRGTCSRSRTFLIGVCYERGEGESVSAREREGEKMESELEGREWKGIEERSFSFQKTSPRYRNRAGRCM